VNRIRSGSFTVAGVPHWSHYNTTNGSLSRKTMTLAVNVLDFTRVLAGPLCSMILGDLGAHVIKVERPGGGDETRGWGPPFDADGESAYFLSVNRNKKSLAADLDSAEDRALVMRLLTEADVVIDNFLPGSLARLGFDRDRILEGHPSLIWCTISGYGPGTRRPGYDFVTQAESGWMAITGPVAGPPMKVGVALADVIAGKDAAIAILAALAERTGGPVALANRRIDISLADSARGALVNVAQNVLVSGSDAARWGNAHPNLVPYQLFDAADRPFVIAVGSDEQWRACALALELKELADDADLATNAGRIANRERVVESISERVRERSAKDWIDRLQSKGIACGLVRTVAESLADTNASAETGLPSSVPGTVRMRPPKLDEHGEELRALGWRAFRR
jgi:crotonobetainyl-CoA:carnitine CoA-transferase CaiB-like acyl-CoA transferase